MSRERSRPSQSSDGDPNTKRRRPRPTSQPSSGTIHPIGSLDWQSTLSSAVDGLPQSVVPYSAALVARTSYALESDAALRGSAESRAGGAIERGRPRVARPAANVLRVTDALTAWANTWI